MGVQFEQQGHITQFKKIHPDILYDRGTIGNNALGFLYSVFV